MNLKSFRQHASSRKKTLTAFLKGLRQRKIKGLDAAAKKLDKKAFAKINCLTCGNCCKTMTPTWTPADIRRTAKHLKITTFEFKKKWLYKDDVGDWLNTSLPCQFLNKDNTCSIYEIRPRDCRGFPHIRHSDFAYAWDVNAENMTSCPITLDVVEKMYLLIEKKDKSVLD